MKRATKKSNTKKVGRPKSTGAGTPMVVRMHKPLIKAIDDWIADTDISRPAAIRQLVEWALAQGRKPAQPVQPARENELHS